jgi:hypothetical protein
MKQGTQYAPLSMLCVSSASSMGDCQAAAVGCSVLSRAGLAELWTTPLSLDSALCDASH